MAAQVTNYEEFATEVRRVSKDLTERQQVLFVKKIAMELLRRVVKRTPVDTGRARGNWQITVGKPATKALDVSGPGAGAQAVAQGVAALTTLPPYSIVWLSNNVPYITVLEFGQFEPPNPGPSKDPRRGRFGRTLVKDGFSVQAPRGMLNLTLAEINEAFKSQE